MKWRWLAIYAAIVAVLFTALIVVYLLVSGGGSREPSWKGIKLTEWMYGHLSINHGEFFDNDGVTAIKAIGTNGLPTLIKMLGTKDSALETMFIGWFHGHLAIEKRACASTAIEILGTNAFSAIPDLVKLTKNEDKDVRNESLFCLSRLQPEKEVLLPVLKERLQDSEADVQERAARILAKRYPEDAERLRVYDLFPKLKRSSTNSTQTNTPTGK